MRDRDQRPTVEPTAIDAYRNTRRLGILAAVTVVLTFLGCMSFTVGGRTYQSPPIERMEDGLFVQTGGIHLAAGADQDVYYPVAYAHPPNLTLDDDESDNFSIVEQQADHFRIHNTSLFSQDATWHARGLHGAPVEPPVEALPIGPVTHPGPSPS